MSARVMQAPPDLPPLRGRIEGGVTRAPHPRPSKLLHPGDPTLIPSPEGRETCCALHGPREQNP